MAFTSDPKADRELISRAEDAVNLSLVRHKPCFLGFLNEREQYILKSHFSHLDAPLSFYGGYENAERKLLCSCEYEISPDDFPIEKIYYKFRKADALTHRDFLGALMSLGVERSCVGDIIVNEGCALCYIKSELSDYIKTQITKIGRVGVTLSNSNECDITYLSRAAEAVINVSSLRLDAITAAAFGLSREQSARLIESGRVFCNYVEQNSVSCRLKPGDTLTVRGKGKLIIKEQLGETKKGRLKLLVEHYR